MNINFVGDLIFGDQPVKFGFGFDSLHHSSGYSNSFKGVEKVFNQAEFNVANFEAIIKDRPKRPTISNWSMCCDKSVTTALLNAKINILNVANNHTLDYGVELFKNTVDILEEASIRVIGKKEKPFTIISRTDLKVAIVGVSYLKVKTSDVSYFYNPSIMEWNSLIDHLKLEKVDRIIIYVHWGNEFIDYPSEKQFQIMKDLSSLGVHAIIGHHPHVLQPDYTYEEIPVFFSLGNFISDYWQKRARISTILNLKVNNKQKFNWKHISCYINDDGCPELTETNRAVEFSNDIHLANINDVNLSRKKLRLEYLKMLSKNFYRIRNKRYFLNWMIRRLMFILKYGREEKRNPDIIYEKYKH